MRKAGKILVVDDYEANLRGLGQLLRSAEYSVTSATNGREALELARRERPDLVLLDVLMPGMSGVEVCRELKRSEETCLTPVVLISGAQERETILAGSRGRRRRFPRQTHRRARNCTPACAR